MHDRRAVVKINMRKGAAIKSYPLGNVDQSKVFKQKKGVVLHAHSSSINNSQDKETVYVSIYAGMKKENVKWLCTYVYLLVYLSLYSHKKEGILAICNNMDGPLRH